MGEHRGYEYARSGNPTRPALEACLASLEGRASRARVRERPGRRGRDPARRSTPGDHVIIPTDAYGGTFRLVARVHERHGIDWTAVDLARPRRARRRVARRDPRWCGSRRRPTRCSPSSTSPRSPKIAHARARARRRRQHVRDAVPAAAARARRRRRRALGDEVPRRPLRRRRRLRRASTTPSSPTSSRSCRTRWARCRRPFDCYLVLRGRQDARRAHGPSLRERAARSSRCSPSTRRSPQVLYPGLPSTRPRRRAPPDARLRRHGLVPSPRRRGRRARRRGAHRGCSRWPSRSGRSSR